MVDAHRLRTTLLVAAGASGLISLAATMLVQSRNGRIDWAVICVPLGLLLGVAAATLDARHAKARLVLSLLAAGLCVAAALLMVARAGYPALF